MLYARTWRFLLSFLLVVVLPMQGYAATRMLACDMRAPVSLTAQAAQAPEPMRVADTMAAGMHEHHHTAGMSMTHDGAQTVMDDMPSPHATQAGAGVHHDPVHGKCTGCAPCCMGAALTASLLVHDPLPAGHAGFAAPAAVHASAYVGLPDRPPQSFLA